MRFSIIAPLLLAVVNAQQPTDAIGSASQLISLGNQAISQAVSGLRSNTNPAVSSLLSYYTASVWGPVTQEIAELTKAAATNPQASSTLASIISEIGPSISALSRSLNAGIPATGTALSSANSAASSQGSAISAATASLSSASSSASAAATSHNMGASIEVGAMGAAGALVLGLAAFL